MSSWLENVHRAVIDNHILTVRRLLDGARNLRGKKEYPTTSGYPLQEAAALGRDDMVRHLVAAGMDVNSYSVNTSAGTRWTALHWAAHGDKASTVEVLLELGADKTALGRWHHYHTGTPLDLACMRGNKNVMVILCRGLPRDQ